MAVRSDLAVFPFMRPGFRFTFDNSSNRGPQRKEEQGEAHGGSSARSSSGPNLEQSKEQLLDERADRGAEHLLLNKLDGTLLVVT